MAAHQACYPDMVRASCTALNDVSRMNETPVTSVHQPRSLAEVQGLLALAAARGLPLVCRGTKHSMGGHSLAPSAIVLDMAYLNAVTIDASARTAAVGAGATWAAVIEAANIHGLTPRTLQSYCTFSV
jgi:FAD/FMN-containing dehydrogenase